MAKATILIGTSGWSYRHWRSKFYPKDLKADQLLSYYGQHFQTVEINNTFYRLPKPQTVHNWYHSTPDDFVFAAKLSQFITHRKRLIADEQTKQAIDRFYKTLVHLKQKLAVVLVQLPPNLPQDNQRLDAFLALVRANELDRTSRLAIEFRHPSWFNDGTFAILSQHNIANVTAHSSNKEVISKVLTADFAYLRFHSSGRLYSSSYSNNELDYWAKYIMRIQPKLRHIYIYFNNDTRGYAIKNAQYLRGKIQP
ncbi:DUF72 domain-containing protein [Candidatus Microgenomates bacterium]|nr:DUF72 domain-containing protein [Candidatus Microgenomates bacterium]